MQHYCDHGTKWSTPKFAYYGRNWPSNWPSKFSRETPSTGQGHSGSIRVPPAKNQQEQCILGGGGNSHLKMAGGARPNLSCNLGQFDGLHGGKDSLLPLWPLGLHYRFCGYQYIKRFTRSL